MTKLRVILLMTFAILTTCASVTDSRKSETDKKIIIAEPEETDGDKYSTFNYSSTKTDEYDPYLVKLDDYTTNGKTYHERHYSYLLGLSEILTEKYGYHLKNNSVGFYYDKVTMEKDRLFLGMDIVCDQELLKSGEGYSASGRRMIETYLQNVLDVSRKYEDIFNEPEIEGVVVGFFWVRDGKKEFVNVWLAKQNIKELFNGYLTFWELVLKSTVTDTEGKKIRITL